jgi:YVTN family beta-propeller protein
MNATHLPSLLALLTATALATLGATKEPVYIGSQACATCHDGPEMGYQFSKWRLSGHARAYSSLALPESPEITRLSGLLEEPHQSRMCLGCHATAADSEIWERDPGFHLEDGLQCEACHGPGSEYAPLHIMRDPEQARLHGLKMPTRDDCMLCHRAKGSHDGVLKTKPFHLETAWQAIAHPTPRPALEPATVPVPAEPVLASPHQFTGVMACAECHTGPKFNFQFSHWRRSKHANAYATLATPEAYRIAREAGVEGSPQRAAQCLQCHVTGHGYDDRTFQVAFDARDGVQCESCHGPGSGYSPEAIMLDKPAARAQGLRETSAATCLPCHDNAHDKPFDYEKALAAIAHPTRAPAAARTEPAYKNPLNPAVTPDGREVWVACEASASVVVVDAVTLEVLDEIAVGRQANDVCFTPCGRRAFVSNRLDDTVSAIDVATRKVVATITVGDEPHGVLVDREGKHLYVLNTADDDISVIDLATLQEIKRLSACRSPWSLALSPDGRQIFVTHALSRLIPFRTPSMSELTVIDTELAMVDDRYVVEAANLLQGIDWHPSGQYALFTLLRTKNLIPMTRINRGWTITNGIGIVWEDGTVDQVLLDQNDLYFADPADVLITPDGKHALVTSSSTHRVAVLDLEKLVALFKNANPHQRRHVIPNHLGMSSKFVIAHIPTPSTPKGIAGSPDGRRAYVANMLDDSLTVIDLQTFTSQAVVPLGGDTELSQRRRGERLFHDASITFRRQFSCSTCHPDGHIDNIVYDIEDDGIGMGPIDNRTLRGINDMAPYKWIGINPSLRRQCGPRLAVFITRIQPFNSDQLDDLHYYLCTIPRPPNRHRAIGEDLTDAQRRGKAMFFRDTQNDGTPIPPGNRCQDCHPPPLYTDGKVHDVGTRFALDLDSKFDAPHLHNIYDSAPYLHNGIAWTLEEIWTKYNPYDQHGVTNDMTKDELNDLIEYLKTL